MKNIFLSACIAACALLIGCAKPSVDYEAEAQALMQLSRDWSAMVGAGNYEAALDVWADDAFMLPPELPVLSGKDAIREFIAETAEIPGFKISWEPKSAHISESGDMAYLIERNVIEVTGENGEPIVMHGKVVTVWRKDANGDWKNVVDMWNGAPPPTD